MAGSIHLLGLFQSLLRRRDFGLGAPRNPHISSCALQFLWYARPPVTAARYSLERGLFFVILLAGLSLSLPSWAGGQKEEKLSASVQALLSRSIADRAAPKLLFDSELEGQQWLFDMSNRLSKKIPDAATRLDFLKTVHYEATRAGLDPQLVIGLIQVESNFRKYAVSSSGARGYMQVMPFWIALIGDKQQNLFHLRTNLRYGCTILRHYLSTEKGDLFRALGRYNGSLGQPEYPNLVLAAWQKNWQYPTENTNATALQATANINAPIKTN